MLQILLVSLVVGFVVAAERADEPQVVRDQVKGSINHGGGRTEWKRVTGKVKVLDTRTLEFADGTRIELDITTPEHDQMAMNGDVPYPCGKEAAEFLRSYIGDQPVSCFRNSRGDGPWSGYVGTTNLEVAMIVNGWALADHSSLHVAEIMARERKLGLWRGKFLLPEEWLAGKRLPGEPASLKSIREEPREQSKTEKTPPAIIGGWNSIDRHVAMGSLFQPVHGVRKREAIMFFEQSDNAITGYAVVADHKDITHQERWTEGRTDLRNIRFANNQLAFEFPIADWHKPAGPIAVERGQVENKGTIRVDARLEDHRLIGRWRMFLADETEVFRGEWEAERAANDQPATKPEEKP